MKVDIRLNPRVLKVLVIQLLESITLSSHWFQSSTCASYSKEGSHQQGAMNDGAGEDNDEATAARAVQVDIRFTPCLKFSVSTP